MTLIAPGVFAILDRGDPRLAPYGLLARPDALARAGLFVVEGRLVLPRLLDEPRFRLHSTLLTRVAYQALGDTAARAAARAPLYLVEPGVMRDITGVAIHRGCLALAERPGELGVNDLPLIAMRRLLVLEGVNNPDNVGGLFRSAAAFGVDAVILGPGCGDPLYRKAVRTSMGGTLQLPFASARAWPAELTALRRHGWPVLALTPAPGAATLDDVARRQPRAALLVGAEGPGLSAAALDASDQQVRIAMPGGGDSLNVTVAASIALHHLA